jgi:hypothetical protein
MDKLFGYLADAPQKKPYQWSTTENALVGWAIANHEWRLRYRITNGKNLEAANFIVNHPKKIEILETACNATPFPAELMDAITPYNDDSISQQNVIVTLTESLRNYGPIAAARSAYILSHPKVTDAYNSFRNDFEAPSFIGSICMALDCMSEYTNGTGVFPLEDVISDSIKTATDPMGIAALGERMGWSEFYLKYAPKPRQLNLFDEEDSLDKPDVIAA